MTMINVTELRQNIHKYLELARQGEEVAISSRGQPVARLVPPVESEDGVFQKLRELREHAVIGDVISPLGEPWEANDVDP